MSLEDRISALTEAITKNNELLSTLISKAQAKVEASAPKAAKVEAEETKAKADDAEEAPRRRGRKPKAAKIPSVSDMKDAAKAYLDAADDEDDYKARRATIKKIVEKFGVERFTEIAEEHRAEALAMLNGEGDGDGEEEDDVV